MIIRNGKELGCGLLSFLKTIPCSLKVPVVLGLMCALWPACSGLERYRQDGMTEEQRAVHVGRLLAARNKQLGNYAVNMSDRDNILQQVYEAPDFVMQFVNEYDGEKYRPYSPTTNQLRIIQQSFEQLPPLHRKILLTHNVGIYFIKDLKGSGISDWIVDEKGDIFTWMVFDSRLLEQNLDEWLSAKERSVYIPDDMTRDVMIEVDKSIPAFFGILLHESTHVVDYVCGITPWVERDILSYNLVREKKNGDEHFVKDIWQNYYQPLARHDFEFRPAVTFYGFENGPKISIADSDNVYVQLAATPFFSLYSTSCWAEDLAEYVMYYHLTQVLKKNYRIIAWSRDGDSYVYEPAKNPRVRDRFELMKRFYEEK